MTLGIGLLTLGAILIFSGVQGLSLVDVVMGAPASPSGGILSTPSAAAAAVDAGSVPSLQPLASLAGSPKQIIDSIVLPIAAKHGIHLTPAQVTAANARHGPTVNGNRSDHQGPPNVAWAADMSNGVLTPEERALAAELAQVFGMTWNMGDGVVSATHNGYRFQLIHGCRDCGGDHTNHVHFGVRKV